MAKLIYAMKIYLFRNQQDVLKLTLKEQGQLERFVWFGALLYTKTWISAPCATKAPAGDLQLWLDFRHYENTDPAISTAARKVLENHLWYLSDELVGLSLFSDNVSPVVKSAILFLQTSTKKVMLGFLSVCLFVC